MSSPTSSYNIKDGLNILLSLPDNLKKPELEFIMRELNILRKMRHVNSLMIVNHDYNTSTDSTNLYDEVKKLNELDKENIHKSLLDINNIIPNETMISNLLVICEYSNKYDMIDNLKNNKLTDYLLITYKLNTTTSEKKVYNLLRVLTGLQTCFREPTNVYNTYGLYSLDDRNILSVMLPDNTNLLKNNSGKDEILYLENIIDNSSKTGYFKSMTVGAIDDAQIGGRLRSTLKKMFRRNKKQTKQKKIRISDIERQNGKDYSFMKATPNYSRKVYGHGPKTQSGKSPMRNSIIAKPEDYERHKKFNNIDNQNIKLLIKKIDLSTAVNNIPDKVKNLEAKYDIVFNYSNMNKLKLLDFVLFTDVGEPSILNIRRYKLSDPNSEAVLSGKLNKKGKDAYKKAKSERLTKRQTKEKLTKEKLTKKMKEVRKQSKLNYALKSDKKYKDLLAELEKLTGFRNILARRRVKAKLNKRKAEIELTLKNHLNNNTVPATDSHDVPATDRLKHFRNFNVFKNILSKIKGNNKEKAEKYTAICAIFEKFLVAVEADELNNTSIDDNMSNTSVFFKNNANFEKFIKLYNTAKKARQDALAFHPDRVDSIINNNNQVTNTTTNNNNDKTIIKHFFLNMQIKLNNIKNP